MYVAPSRGIYHGPLLSAVHAAIRCDFSAQENPSESGGESGLSFKPHESVPVAGGRVMGLSKCVVVRIVVGLLVTALFGSVASAFSAATASSTAATLKPSGSGPQLPFAKSARYFDPALQGSLGRVSVLVAVDASSPATDVGRYLTGARSLPAIGQIRLIRGLIESERIPELQSSPGVLAILKDRPIGFDAPNKPAVNSRLPVNFGSLRSLQPASIGRESLTGRPETTMRQVVNFTGARQAWNQLGVDGTGVTIAGLPPSKSGTYHFGVLFEWNFGLDLFPVLVVDSTTAGVYDTAYLDLSFDWWLNGFSPNPVPDFSFADEPTLVPASGNVVAARDMDGDGYPDISAGAVAHELDIWGLNPSATNRFKVLDPVDRAGDYIAMVYDWAGHGTR